MGKKYILSLLASLIIFVIAIANPIATYANNPPDQGHSSLSSSNQAPANGSSTINVQVTLQDSSGNAISGDSVTFSAPNDTTAAFNPSSTTLNSSGQASFTITSNNAGTDDITVTDTTSNTTLADLGQVTFTSTSPTDTPTPTCEPVDTPDLTAATSSSPSQVTLTWTDSGGSVNTYVLAYGTSSGKYIYGNPNIGSQGTTTYTVSSLTQGTTYYFAIQAANACSTSGFSNEMSAVAGGATPTSTSSSGNTSVSPAAVSPSQQVSPTSAVSPTAMAFGSPTPAPGGSLFGGINIWKILSIIFIIIILGVAGYFLYMKYAQKNKIRKIDPTLKEQTDEDSYYDDETIRK